MPSNDPAALIDEIAGIAATLEDGEVQDTLAALMQRLATAKLRLLIAGTTGSGRASLANALLARPDLLPVSPIPKAPVGLHLTYGPAPTVQALRFDGSRMALPVERLRGALAGEIPNLSTLEITADSDLLTTLDLLIEPLEAGRTMAAWRAFLSGIDFVLLILNATSLLSDLERRFVRDYLVEGFGLDRVAIAVNQMDRIPEDERSSIMELVHTFLGPFSSRPMVVELSVAEAGRAPAGGQQPNAADPAPSQEGFAALADLVRHELPERHTWLRDEGLRQALAGCVESLAATAEQQTALASLTDEEAQAMTDEVRSQREWLERRVQRAQNRVAVYVNTLIKEQLLRDIEDFGAVFRRRLPLEIDAVDDVAAIRKHLPGYIEKVWEDFLQSQVIAARSKLVDEARAIDQLIESDLADLLGERLGRVGQELEEQELTAAGLRPFLTPRRGQHRVSGAIRGLGYGGVVMMAWSLPLGLATLGASHVLRRFYGRDLAISDKQAMLESALNASRELERTIKQQVHVQFTQIADTLSQQIGELYRQAIAGIQESLETELTRRTELEGRRSEITRLAHITIPELRRRVAETGRQEVVV